MSSELSPDMLFPLCECFPGIISAEFSRMSAYGLQGEVSNMLPKYLPNLERLTGFTFHATSALWLGSFTKLRVLGLHGASDDHWAEIAELKGLETIDVDESTIQDKTLLRLLENNSATLTSLRLYQTYSLTEQALSIIGKFCSKTLTFLELAPIEYYLPDGLSFLFRQFSAAGGDCKLETLVLRTFNRVKEVSVSEFAEFPSCVQNLYLDDIHIENPNAPPRDPYQWTDEDQSVFYAILDTITKRCSNLRRIFLKACSVNAR